jgi:hypothetical protein
MQIIAHRLWGCACARHRSAGYCARTRKAGTREPRLSSWLCARIKLWCRGQRLDCRGKSSPSKLSRSHLCNLASDLCNPVYALRRGRTVKSRTCARMLDICIPLSCDRYGITSATNWSSINSRTYSCRLRSPPESRSGTLTSSAFASRSREDSVGVAFSFSIFETYVRGTDMRSASWR